MAGRLHAGHGWQMLIAGILAWELWCEDGELLSEGFDRLLERHPVWPRIVVILIAAHVANLIPTKIDLVNRLFYLVRLSRRLNRAILHFTRVRQKACQ